MTPTERAFHAAMTAVRDDWTAVLVFADWLDENDHPDRAAGYRMLARLQRAPLPDVDTRPHVHTWFDGDVARAAHRDRNVHRRVPEPYNDDPMSDLPGAWYAALRDGAGRLYSTPAAAYLSPWRAREAAVRAWGRLSAADRLTVEASVVN